MEGSRKEARAKRLNAIENNDDSDHEQGTGPDDRSAPPLSAIATGGRLRSARDALKLTQKALADIAGVKLPTLKDYERGKSIPGGEALAGFARARINVLWLLGDGSAPMLLDTVEKAEKTAVYTAALFGDEDAQRRVDESRNTNMAKLTEARELVERVAKELEYQPGSVIMGALITCVRLGRMNEDGVRDMIRAVMVQAVLDSRS